MRVPIGAGLWGKGHLIQAKDRLGIASLKLRGIGGRVRAACRNTKINDFRRGAREDHAGSCKSAAALADWSVVRDHIPAQHKNPVEVTRQVICVASAQCSLG